jgi:hypothetical protein
VRSSSKTRRPSWARSRPRSRVTGATRRRRAGVDYFIRAGEQAELGWAKDQAAILYREALDLAAEDDAEQLRALRRRSRSRALPRVHIPDARQLMR